MKIVNILLAIVLTIIILFTIEKETNMDLLSYMAGVICGELWICVFLEEEL